MEGRVLVVGRAEVAQPRVRLVGQPIAQGLEQARLADAGLARRAARPGPRRAALGASGRAAGRSRARARPAASGAARAEPRSGSRSFGPRSPGTPRPGRQSRRACVPRSANSNSWPSRRRVPPATTTVPGSASACRRAARFGVSPTTASSCAAPSPIRSPTTTSPVAMPTRAASGSPPGALSRATAAVDREAGADGPFRLVLVRHGPAEVGQHAVAHELGDVAFEPGDLGGHGGLVGMDDLAHLLRVEAGRTAPSSRPGRRT